MKVVTGLITVIAHNRVHVCCDGKSEWYTTREMMEIPIHESMREAMFTEWESKRSKSLARHRVNFRKLFKEILKDTE